MSYTIGTKSNFYEAAKKNNALNPDNSFTNDGFILTLKEIGVYRSNADLSTGFIALWFEDELCVFKRNENGNWHDVSTFDNKQTL